MREALNILVNEEGIENAWARHERFAHAVWAALAIWGNDGALTPNITNPKHRSTAVTCIETSDGNATKIREWREEIAGVTLGIGLGMAEFGSQKWHNYFRIGHMGHLNVPMVMGTLGAIDCALKALNIPHGAGALDAASKVISEV